VKSLFSLSVVFCVAGTAPAQQTWKVHHTGAYGAHFTDLPAAVAAANPGDEILLFASAPSWTIPYTAAVITKPVRIVGFSVGAISGVQPYGAGLRGTLVIHGIPAGTQAVLSNLNISYDAFPATSGIVAVDCAGDVLLEDVYYVGSGIRTSSYVHFERCHNVVLRGCGMSLGASPITAIDSQLLFSFTNIGTTDPEMSPIYPAIFGTPPADSFPALHLVNSEATLVASNLSGADYYQSIMWGGSVPARPAVRLENSTLRIGPASNVLGGQLPQWPHVVPGYEIVSSSVVERDPRSSITAIPWIPPTDLPIDRPMASVDLNWAIAGQSMSVWVAGQANGFAVLAFGDWSPFPQVTPYGTLALDPSTVQVLDLVACAPPDGWANRVYQLPVTTPVCHAWALQAMTLAPTGEFGLSIPSPFTVAWPNGVTP
jgi:hypothetical protein